MAVTRCFLCIRCIFMDKMSWIPVSGKLKNISSLNYWTSSVYKMAKHGNRLAKSGYLQFFSLGSCRMSNLKVECRMLSSSFKGIYILGFAVLFIKCPCFCDTCPFPVLFLVQCSYYIAFVRFVGTCGSH